MGRMVASDAQKVEGDVTNNACEYKGLLLLLNYMVAQRWFHKKILVVMDAQLVVQ